MSEESQRWLASWFGGFFQYVLGMIGEIVIDLLKIFFFLACIVAFGCLIYKLYVFFCPPAQGNKGDAKTPRSVS